MTSVSDPEAVRTAQKLRPADWFDKNKVPNSQTLSLGPTSLEACLVRAQRAIDSAGFPVVSVSDPRPAGWLRHSHAGAVVGERALVFSPIIDYESDRVRHFEERFSQGTFGLFESEMAFVSVSAAEPAPKATSPDALAVFAVKVGAAVIDSANHDPGQSAPINVDPHRFIRRVLKRDVDLSGVAPMLANLLIGPGGD